MTYHFHSVGWQVIEDRIRPAGNTVAIKDLPVAAQYVWSPHYVDELILIDRDRNADGDLSDAGERLYVQRDANYNVTSVVGDADAGTAGNQWGVVERYQYDPYGQRTVLDANWALDADGVSDVQMVHGHQGGQHDVESHLVHFRNRDLNVVLGRWTRQDPLGYVDGGSLYEYVRGGPVHAVDPSGLMFSQHKWRDSYPRYPRVQGMTSSGYLVVTKRASPNESYRGVDRLPPFFFGSAEPDAKAVEDYVFGGWRDDSGLIVDLGRATELLSRFNDQSMYEIIRVDRSATFAGDGLELTGYDVACVSGDCASIFNVDIELVWRCRETHFNRYGLARSAIDAMELLKWYVAQQLPDSDDALEVVAVYRQTGAG